MTTFTDEPTKCIEQTEGSARGPQDAPKVFKVPVAEIVKEPDWQVRDRLNPHHVEVLRGAYKAGNFVPPVKLADINGRLYLIDGFHRLEAVGLQASINATIEKMSANEARLKAADANRRNGQALKPRERKRAERIMLQAFIADGKHLVINAKGRKSAKSFRAIAEELYGGSPSHEAVRTWIKRHHKAVWNRWWGGAEDADDDAGGLKGEPLTADELAFEEFTTQATIAFESLQRIGNPVVRGDAIGYLQELLKKAESTGPYVPSEF